MTHPNNSSKIGALSYVIHQVEQKVSMRPMHTTSFQTPWYDGRYDHFIIHSSLIGQVSCVE